MPPEYKVVTETTEADQLFLQITKNIDGVLVTPIISEKRSILAVQVGTAFSELPHNTQLSSLWAWNQHSRLDRPPTPSKWVTFMKTLDSTEKRSVTKTLANFMKRNWKTLKPESPWRKSKITIEDVKQIDPEIVKEREMAEETKWLMIHGFIV